MYRKKILLLISIFIISGLLISIILTSKTNQHGILNSKNKKHVHLKKRLIDKKQQSIISDRIVSDKIDKDYFHLFKYANILKIKKNDNSKFCGSIFFINSKNKNKKYKEIIHYLKTNKKVKINTQLTINGATIFDCTDNKNCNIIILNFNKDKNKIYFNIKV